MDWLNSAQFACIERGMVRLVEWNAVAGGQVIKSLTIDSTNIYSIYSECPQNTPLLPFMPARPSCQLSGAKILASLQDPSLTD